MARTPSPKIQAAITGTIRKITYLFEIGSKPLSFAFSSRGLVDYNGRTFSQVGASLDRISTGRGGAQSCRFKIPNHQYAWSVLFLSQDMTNAPLKIWRVFGDPPYALADGYLKFQGVISSIPSIDPDIIVVGATKGAGVLKIPNVFLRPPFVNHMPEPGTVIEWKGEKFILQTREDSF